MCLGLCACASLNEVSNCYGLGNEECVKKGYRTDQVIHETTAYEIKKQKDLAKELTPIFSSCGVDLYAGMPPLTPTQSKCIYDKVDANICATGKMECYFKNYAEFEEMLNTNIKQFKKR